jgi:hypothetical protein
MRSIRTNLRPWLTGLLLACAGVAITRILAPGCGRSLRAGLTLAGQLTALGGLLIIALGIRRRVHPPDSGEGKRTPASRPQAAAPGPI